MCSLFKLNRKYSSIINVDVQKQTLHCSRVGCDVMYMALSLSVSKTYSIRHYFVLHAVTCMLLERVLFKLIVI